ncbi:MAG: prolyl oligopeptidase family serine peptidase [Phycisphaeraceae bacterium]|nr:prolyl oligopeptidase family serine peptidase [Phycisphaeraceae bacterium]
MLLFLSLLIAQPLVESPVRPEVAEVLHEQEVTLERIMAHPDWIGRFAEQPYWSDDGKAIYFQRKRPGVAQTDLYRRALTEPAETLVRGALAAEASTPAGVWSSDRRRKLFARHGDIFLRDLDSNRIDQLTRTHAVESSPRFMRDPRAITYVRDGVILVRWLDTGLEDEVVHLLAADDPDTETPGSGFLAEQQRRLFEVLNRRREEQRQARAHERQIRVDDPSRAPLPWYLGKDVRIIRSSLSPSGRYVAVVLTDASENSGRRDAMPSYVTESGYVESRSVRTKVGDGRPRAERLVLLDLLERASHPIDHALLPGISDDPLAFLQSNPDAVADSPRPAQPRPVRFGALLWNPVDDRLCVQAFSHDNKERWLALIVPEKGELIPLEHDHDEAWINTRFTAFEWLADGSAIWFLSERSGWSHLYLREPDASEARALTTGTYEIHDVSSSPDGRWLYFRANARHHGEYEVHRLRLEDSRIEQLTDLRGLTEYVLSPDGSFLLLRHSKPLRPPELYVQRAVPLDHPRRLTFFIEPEFEAIAWREPEFVEIPSPHSEPIPARLYPTLNPHPDRPAVIFIHGAGYLQNAHKGWSTYFREFMFHTLLSHAGYVVLDLDYRASAGYGRDWRTAIYRRMGEPEVEDLVAAAAWLVDREGVAPDRIGLYGGSYGGFLTLMALFTRPETFACGAALRPVTDWAHYSHGYTGNILNVPQLDPEAYQRSSPIEWAEGLQRPLLICHGMQDDNVFFQDTVRLAQRLIELEKTDWEVAIYPLEPHGFIEPSSWLDQYRRILKLFETNLKSP